MGLLNLSLPIIGQSGATEDQKTRDNFNLIQTTVNGNLDASNAPGVGAALVWGEVQRAQGIATSASGVGAVNLLDLGPAAGVMPVVGGNGSFTRAFRFDPADWAVTGMTTNMRIRWVCGVNGTAPGVTAVPGLYVINAMGAPAAATPSVSALGAAVVNSTVSFVTPAAGSLVVTPSPEFPVPSANFYAFVANLSGAPAANSQILLQAQLQIRHV